MLIFRNLDEIEHNKNTIVTLGTFDGIHLGHREIIETVVKKAADSNFRSFLITFDPHPRKVISKDDKIKLLCSLDEKIEIIKSLGMENIFLVNFTREFSQQSPEEFIQKYIIEGIGVKEIVIGYDHHFGKGRGGNVETLLELGNEKGFDVTAVGEFKIGSDTVSSTKIRNAVLSGDCLTATEMLGRFYSFSGTVVQGDSRGKELGFPTANLKIDDEDKLLPAIGIYAVECIIEEKKYYGLLSIGTRPTFYSQGSIIPEIYLFDFDQNIYDKTITVNLVEKIRDEQKFSSVDELIEQMNKDKKAGQEILAKLIN
jgi:riboflavin kinase / FMN adenylyltransferase